MGNFNNNLETKVALNKQRNKFLWLVALLSAIAIGFLVSTVVLALKNDQNDDNVYPAVNVNYYVWTHPQPLQATRNNINIKVPKNVTFFSVMEHGANEASHFRYEFKQYEFGKYVTSIGGVKESVNENMFWMLYKLKNIPDMNNPPPTSDIIQIGIDDIRVKDGEIYLFWLTKSLSNLDDGAVNGNRLSLFGASTQPCINGQIQH